MGMSVLSAVSLASRSGGQPRRILSNVVCCGATRANLAPPAATTAISGTRFTNTFTKVHQSGIVPDASMTGTASEKEYIDFRCSELARVGLPSYPTYTGGSHVLTIQTVHQRHGPTFGPNQWEPTTSITVVGRISAKREASRKLVFFDVRRHGHKVQVIAKENDFTQRERFRGIANALTPGDIIWVEGYPGKTKVGELSIVVRDLQLLSPCLHRLPSQHYGLIDPETRFRQRYLDMIVNEEVVTTLRTRARIIQYLRDFLNERGFTEVETPILSSQAGGANACPFHTYMNETGMKMQLRIAPELDLKRLVIGGIDKVYEIGKQFRNEGIDATHNPEFTTCELYQSYSNLDELMKMTETFLSGVARQVSGSPIIEYPSNVTDADKQEQKPLSIDFSPPFARIDVLPALEDALGEVLPDLNDTASIDALIDVFRRRNLELPAEPRTLPRLVDALIGQLIEERCVQPTFVTGHPLCLSPLAKERKGSKGVAERFELFVAGKELINAYDELNDPFEQRSRFAQQLKNRHSGDEDVPLPDEEFCRALEYGLPPTVGWGLGIDRLCMLLTGAAKIREVITFPVLKPIRPSTDGAPTTLIANSQIIESHEE